MQREAPYQGLTCTCTSGKPESLRGACTGAAWLSSARVVRCWVKSRNERNPYRRLYVSEETATTKWRKAGMTSSQHGPYVLGDTHATMAETTGRQPARGSQSQQTRSQFRLQAATRLHEVGVASNRGSAHHGEYVPGSCTHRPSHHESRQPLKPPGQLAREVGVEGGVGDWGEVVTR
jgi:hypothetical protein